MNKYNTGSKTLAQWGLFFLLTGFISTAQAAIVVNMEVRDKVGSADEKELFITTRGKCSGTNNPNGCIQVKGKNQQINFNLIGSQRCSGDTWKLESVVLSKTKGQVGITKVASEDFGADMATGKIIDPESQNDHHIGIRDKNTAAYEVWYTVYAECGGLRIDTDPRIKNDGTGHG